MTKNNSTSARVGTQPRNRRRISPRKTAQLPPPPRTNRKLPPRDPDSCDAEYNNARDSWWDNNADGIDSRTIALSPSKPPAKTPWKSSPVRQRLQAQPGLWIPAWVGLITKHPARACVLAWLLGRFENVNAQTAYCRATLVDDDDVRWWGTTVPEIAKAVGLDEQSVRRAIKWLTKQKLIESQTKGGQGTWLRPQAKPLIAAYIDATDDKTLEGELKLADDSLQWHESTARSQLMGAGVLGVKVLDVLLEVCDGNPGPAAMLSTIGYWMDRAQIVRWDDDDDENGDGDLYEWIAKSCRQFADELGANTGTVQRWLRDLVDRGLVVVRHWVLDHSRDRGRPTQHLRPALDALDEALGESFDLPA